MSELSRTSALASLHTELGSGLEDWNGMGTAWSYHSDPNDEHDAARQPGTRLDVVSDDFNGTAVVEAIPFFDPSKSRTNS